MKALLMLALLAFSCAAHAQSSVADYPSVWNCDAAKFNWYCDEEEERAKASRRKPEPKLRPESAEIQTAEQLRAELKRREDIAIMQPTDANLKNYLELWQLAQEKGAVFADNWRRVVWQNPSLDYSLRRPSNNAAIKTFDVLRDTAQDQQLRMLAKDHGLIFFFRSDCPYCHAMAPILKALANKYGLDVLGVSIDGGNLPEFPSPSDGRAHATAWGVERVPALFIGSKKTGDRAPIGFGAMAMSDIVNRIFVLTGTKPGDNF